MLQNIDILLKREPHRDLTLQPFVLLMLLIKPQLFQNISHIEPCFSLLIKLHPYIVSPGSEHSDLELAETLGHQFESVMAGELLLVCVDHDLDGGFVLQFQVDVLFGLEDVFDAVLAAEFVLEDEDLVEVVGFDVCE